MPRSSDSVARSAAVLRIVGRAAIKAVREADIYGPDGLCGPAAAAWAKIISKR
jgi:hypothetical protein